MSTGSENGCLFNLSLASSQTSIFSVAIKISVKMTSLHAYLAWPVIPTLESIKNSGLSSNSFFKDVSFHVSFHVKFANMRCSKTGKDVLKQEILSFGAC